MRLRTLSCVALLVLGVMASGAEAQLVIQSGAIKTIRAGSPIAASGSGRLTEADSTVFRIMPSTTTSDTSLPMSTSGWTRIGLQHKISAATLNFEYTIRPEWSNDRTNWTATADSILPVIKAAATAVSMDTIVVRPFTYVRFIASRNPTNTTSTTIATGTLNISAKGVK